MRCRNSFVSTLLIVSAVLLAAAGPLAAQGAEPIGPIVRQAVAFDVSPPLRDVVVPAPAAPGQPREVPLRVVEDLGRPTDAPGVADAARQTQDRPFPGAAVTPLPLFVFEGLSDDDNAALGEPRVVPPDTEGDIGPDHYVQWINLIVNIWTVQRDAGGNPTGVTQVAGFPKPGNSFFANFNASPLCRDTNDGDPIVLYDHLADRWLVSQFAVDPTTGTIDGQCVAVSTSPDPTGTYYRWEFTVSPGEENDYPKFGLMPDAYYLSTRDFPAVAASFAGAGAFDRQAMLAGAASPTFIKFSLPCLSNNCPDAIQPPHLEGPAPAAGTPGYFTRAWDDNFDGPLTGADGYRVWRFVPDFVTPANSSFTEQAFVVGTPYDSTMCGFFQRNCIPQASSAQTLDPIDELQMYRAQYRSFPDRDVIVLNTTVDATGTNVAGIRWAVLGNADPAASGTWALEQDGTYAPADGQNRWMGSAAMDGRENLALGYSVSSSNTDPSIRYTTREAGDPPGTLPGGEEVMQAGLGAQLQATRWGDYSTMSVDPEVDCTFWYTQEYYANTAGFDFKTRVGVFQMPNCGACEPTEPGTELTCDDGLDNDCDGLTDCQDTTDCGADPACACDNDGLCEAGETCDTCPNDCPSGTTSGAVCGNGICEAGNGEDCVSCAADCAGRQSGRPADRFCCGDGDGQNPVPCSDSRCTASGFACTSVPANPGSFCCGDLVCDPGESCSNCALDCAQPPEICSDGIDNDCNGLVDCSDPFCAGQQICQPVDCSTITNKQPCNAEPNCRWDNRNKVCVPN